MTNESSSRHPPDAHCCPQDIRLGLINILLTTHKPQQADNGAVTAHKASKSHKNSMRHRPLVKVGEERATNILPSAFCAAWPTLPLTYWQKRHPENAKALIRKCKGWNHGWDSFGTCDQYSTSAIVWLISLRVLRP